MPDVDEFGMPVSGNAVGRNKQSDWNQTDSTKIDFIKNKPTVATASVSGLMSASDKSKLDALNPNEKGYFSSAAALRAAFPTGQSGWFATVGATDSVWAWDSSTSDWVDTHSHSINPTWDSVQGKPTLSIYDNVITIGNNSLTVPQNDKGYFSSAAALRTAFPTGQNGWFAFVGKILWTWNQNDWRCSQEQANWTQSDNTQVDFIKNKPVIDLNYDVIP